MDKTVLDKELLKITRKYSKDSYMPIIHIKQASQELLACEPLIPKRTSRSQKNLYEYDLSKYKNSVAKIEESIKNIHPYLRGEYTVRIPKHPMETLKDLDVFLSDYGYTKKDIKTILNMINFYDVNISWSKEQREKREKAEIIANIFEQPVFSIFKNNNI